MRLRFGIPVGLLGLLIAGIGFSPAAAPPAAGKLRVLLLTGKNNHDWAATTPVLKKIFEDSGRFAVDVLTDPSTCTAASLAAYDAIADNWTNFPSTAREWGAASEQAVLEFVRSGKGFVTIHAASATFPTWPEFQSLVGATWGPETGHGPVHAFKVEMSDRDHPAARAVGDFEITDELWHRMKTDPAARVLCRAFSEKAKGGTGNWEPVAFTTSFGQGRGFHLVLGHDVRAMENPKWRALLLQGTEWAATGSVGAEIPSAAPPGPLPKGSAAVEQTAMGPKAPPAIVASFDGLGEGFEGPQGTAVLRNPSDNSLAVGPDHIVQIVNSKMAVFTKKGAKFETTGQVLFGPVDTNNVFRNFGSASKNNNGDAVVRYDQLADRWLIVMPIFRRLPPRDDDPPAPKSGDPAHVSPPAVKGQPGPAMPLFQPPKPEPRPGSAVPPPAKRVPGTARPPQDPKGAYAMCYAVSTGPDPLGSYYRYEFIRPLFPDYPRPAVWPDGYYVPTSTGDNIIQKHIYVAEREKMLRGEPAREQGLIIDGVNFLNAADIDGRALPPAGAPAIILAAGGAQLKKILEDDGIYAWALHVDWNDSARTRLEGPVKIPVAPYRYLGGGQLEPCVPQPGTDRRLDTQGDKIMARLVYRRIGDRESLVVVHSVSTAVGGGGVRWYEFRLGPGRKAALFQQGTFAPDRFFRWMGSPAMDADGNIGLGYSFGGTPHFPGQRFAGRIAGDPPGLLTLAEAILAEGEAAQTNTLRWMDYSQTAMDPVDDRTIWFVGDYLKKGAPHYSTRIGAFRLAATGSK